LAVTGLLLLLLASFSSSFFFFLVFAISLFNIQSSRFYKGKQSYTLIIQLMFSEVGNNSLLQ
jgi:hypothetical protein